jgi:hypothetical protein
LVGRIQATSIWNFYKERIIPKVVAYGVRRCTAICRFKTLNAVGKKIKILVNANASPAVPRFWKIRWLRRHNAAKRLVVGKVSIVKLVWRCGRASSRNKVA